MIMIIMIRLSWRSKALVIISNSDAREAFVSGVAPPNAELTSLRGTSVAGSELEPQIASLEQHLSITARIMQVNYMI